MWMFYTKGGTAIYEHQFNKQLLFLWEANIDIQFFVSHPYAVAQCIVSYYVQRKPTHEFNVPKNDNRTKILQKRLLPMLCIYYVVP